MADGLLQERRVQDHVCRFPGEEFPLQAAEAQQRLYHAPRWLKNTTPADIGRRQGCNALCPSFVTA